MGIGLQHDDVIKWKHFPREAGDLRRHRGHYDVNVMNFTHIQIDDVIGSSKSESMQTHSS